MKFEDLFCDSFERILSDFKTNEDRLQGMVGLMRSDRSRFCQEMRKEPYLLSEEQVLRAAERYRLGGSRNGETVFWLIDEANRVRDGIVGDGFASVLLKQRGILDGAWCAQHCLFGMHLLAEAHPRVPVAVVEDVRCAVILSEVYPTFVWLATGYPELAVAGVSAAEGQEGCLLSEDGFDGVESPRLVGVGEGYQILRDQHLCFRFSGRKVFEKTERSRD